MIKLPEAWIRSWRGRDPFERVFALEGEIYKRKRDHQTLRFQHGGRAYFAKLHWGVGWREILSHLLRLRRPVLGAENEWRAIRRLESLGIPTTPLVGYGLQGRNPARRRSFVITEALPPTVSLEALCRDWPERPPEAAFKRHLIARVARIARSLHSHGLNHRDLYLCHFHLDVSGCPDSLGPGRLKLYLIDLHRVQFRRRTPRRWRIKDIAGLCFSSMEIGLSRRDYLRFIRIYEGRPLRQALGQNKRFWRGVERRAGALNRKWHRKMRGK